MQQNDTALTGNATPGSLFDYQRLWSAFLGEERPRDMLILLTILVLLLHAWLLTRFMQPEEKLTQAEPLVMEVSMIAIAAPKKAVAEPPKPAPPAPPPPEKKSLPKKVTPPKPVVKKPPPVEQKAPEFAPFEPFEPYKPASPAKQSAPSSSASTASSSSTAAPTASEPAFTEANFRANYAHNPKPDYPAIARGRGWQGKVLLRVKVSAQGLSDAVSVEQSSGHDILDESAVEAVKKWRFIPAKRGDTPVASSVIVPIDFKLRN